MILWHINIIYLCDKENLLMVMIVFNCTIDLPKLMEIILMAVHKRPKKRYARLMALSLECRNLAAINLIFCLSDAILLRYCMHEIHSPSCCLGKYIHNNHVAGLIIHDKV
jgi:hypothetical protein